MKEKYLLWITENVKEVFRTCREHVDKMHKAFPELTKVRGFYFVEMEGRRHQHWWLTGSDGVIVDPTVSQFMYSPLNEYIPWVEGDAEPKGKCMWCGNMAYRTAWACSEDCEMKLEKHYNTRSRSER